MGLLYCRLFSIPEFHPCTKLMRKDKQLCLMQLQRLLAAGTRHSYSSCPPQCPRLRVTPSSSYVRENRVKMVTIECAIKAMGLSLLLSQPPL